ncbi:LPXTG cell wall anchor domain-containing protein [Sporosarcina aquimarina]|uniref:LPXTG cell wall anchor domain-containing protein n=1 Tax=Sporosarcina aquimarina TaxID=114975 RepID=UPI00203A3FC2|nr:LPXTG cell wall anchor domain-containing protein [Sporosarcina aquimarina]MCM3757530.1 LPXTG cell wall anchor domain-containing protein [Sporosarcina aquimarina]
MEKLLIISLTAIGGFMLSITFNSLGEQGNTIMKIVGALFLTVAMIALVQRNKKE